TAPRALWIGLQTAPQVRSLPPSVYVVFHCPDGLNAEVKFPHCGTNKETPKEVYVRLRDLYQKWVKPATKPVKQIGETIILEQFLRMLCPELQVWIREHDPPSAEEAARLADVFVAARRKNQPWSYTHWKMDKDRPSPRRPTVTAEGGKSMEVGHVRKTC
uniref:SCAN box domain-containing protein n=1 Tax=Pygocentrus nattereri TaxID=42514 RepID=A0AAR2K8K9_PYGNA